MSVDKRPKLSPADATAWPPSSFEGFHLQRVLSHDPGSKTLAVLGSFEGRTGQAVVRLTRKHLNPDPAVAQQFLAATTRLSEPSLHNDIYTKYDGFLPEEYAKVDVDITYPATDKHIVKAEAQPLHLVRETGELYEGKVLPLIKAIPPSRLQWVRNILNKTAEAERLVFEDPDPDTGFMLHPDLKWDQVTTQQLYCVVLCHRADILSLRSLTADHLPLLKNIRDKAALAVAQKYGVAADQLRMYVHYPPSYYHFHVHVTHVQTHGLGCSVGKAHLLDDIIENIERYGSDYYQKRTLTLMVGEGDDLWQQVYKETVAAD